jgi:hypothetical protein
MEMARFIDVPTIPDPSLMVKIGATSFTVAEAVAELAANSFDARVYGRTDEEAAGKKMEIDVLVTQEEIRVIDNGKGMPLNVLKEAIRLSVDMDRVTNSTNSRKGMFGMGMKTACASLGHDWSITTRPVGSELEYFVSFDLQEVERLSRLGRAEWKARIEERERTAKGPIPKHDYGTAISVRRLRDQNPMPGSVLSLLGASYGPHIRQGDSIRVNNEAALPRAFNLIEGTRIEIDEPCGEHRITGWVGLDIITHNDDAFGLNLYRKSQLVSAWDKSWFPVHLMTSRIQGEINLDFVPPNFYKKGFETQSAEWMKATGVMKKALFPVVRASRDVSRGRNDPMKFARAAQAMQKIIGKTMEIGPLLGGTEGGAGETGAGDGDGEEEYEVESGVINIGTAKIRICSTLANLEDEKVPWSPLYDDEEHELQAVINNQSTLFLQSDDTALLTTIGIADCLLQFLIMDMGIDPSKAWQVRNRWLHVSAKGK